MKTKHFLFFVLFLFMAHSISAQWTLVWSDEFNGSSVNSRNWSYDIGTGDWGWGNNELQYYRQENATVSGGQLHITARRQSYGGKDYTSARLKTQNKVTVGPYGKIEARIQLPSFMGSWPAFWMLGTNQGSVGWPRCGEIDIMETVNRESKIYGTMHWQDHNNTHASYAGSVSKNVTQWHVYSIEWDAHLMKWFVDGHKFHEASILNSVNGTDEFHKPFFILLNLAIGGTWPGHNIDNSAFPATMKVDYIRVYSAEGGGNPSEDLYVIKNRHTGKCIDVSDISNNNGADIHQWDYVGGANQKWKMIDRGNKYVSLIASHSGKALRGKNGNVFQYTYNESYWTEMIERISVGSGYYLLKVRDSGQCLRVKNSSTSNGASIILTNCNSNYWSQMWSFTSLKNAEANNEAIISLNSEQPAVRAFPNPLSGNILNIDLNNLEGLTTIKLFDMTGKQILEKRFAEQQLVQLELDTEPGVYILQINNNKESFVEKLNIK